jgi:hypothetical protein
VLHGRLLEIDLGDEARARNIEMTERARRRLQGQIDEEEQDESKGRPRKVRLGRDGKPMRSRNRRGSDDIKRDQLVEEFLSENRRKRSPSLVSEILKANVVSSRHLQHTARAARQPG